MNKAHDPLASELLEESRMKRKASLFMDFPLDGEIQVGEERLSTPYHVYDGSLLSIGGTIDLSAAKALLAKEYLAPLTDENGRALAAFWIADFTDANLGPHHELQFSLFAASESEPNIPSGRYAIFHALAVRPETKMVCHGLWNNTKRVVQYNSEHLFLDANYTQSTIVHSDGKVNFEFLNSSGDLLVCGHVRIGRHQSLGPLWNMIRQVGFRGMYRSLRADYVEVPVVNTRSNAARENLVSRTYSRSSKQIVAPFSKHDKIEIGHAPYSKLGFEPDFIHLNQGVGFVYLRPEPLYLSDIMKNADKTFSGIREKTGSCQDRTAERILT